MMQRSLRILFYIVTFLFSMFLFLPKESIYYFIEKELQQNKIILSGETLKAKIFGVDILDTNIYYNGINIANIEKVESNLFIFYSTIKIQNIALQKSLENILPKSIDNIEIKHTIFDFNTIHIYSAGSFGTLEGRIDILNNILTLELLASKSIQNKSKKLLENMKLKDGKYYYEYKF